MNISFAYRFSHQIQGVTKTWLITPIIGKSNERQHKQLITARSMFINL